MASTLRTHELTKSYSGRTVVRGVSLDVNAGEVVGLLGPNGAGKTTTFYMVVGLTSPASGRVPAGRAGGTHAPPDVATGDRLPPAGPSDLPRPDVRGQHPRHPRDARRRSPDALPAAARSARRAWP